MRRLRTRPVFLAVALVAAGCNEGPITPELVGPSFEISDAAHNGGNENFFFLPPMVASPTPAGTFDDTLDPTVQICVWTGTDCGTTLELYELETGRGSETVRVSKEDEHYIVNWHTDDILTENPLDDGETYRIRIIVEGQLLGFADVEVVNSGRGLKNVNTDEFIALKDGRTLPIKFRIEEGALSDPQVLAGPGRDHSCALSGGVVYCWGSNAFGQLGDGTTGGSSLVPQPISAPPGVTFVSLSLSHVHTCAVSTGGEIYCWGRNRQGVLGTGEPVFIDPTPKPVSAPGVVFTDVSAGLFHTCGLAEGGVAYCWGRGASGELGDGSSLARSTPGPVPSTEEFVTISAGGRGAFAATCGTTSTSQLFCWGALNTNFRAVPTLMPSPGAFAAASVGLGAAYGLTETGAVHRLHYFFVLPPEPGPSMATISVGFDHRCAVTSANVGYCWGSNTFGQLGIGTTGGGSSAPQPVLGPGFISITAGPSSTCAVTVDGDALCWGRNASGQLGDGTTTDSSAPGSPIPLPGTP
jgi:alpha-tubulin suppressor-like RCC1 family protein